MLPLAGIFFFFFFYAPTMSVPALRPFSTGYRPQRGLRATGALGARPGVPQALPASLKKGNMLPSVTLRNEEDKEVDVKARKE